VSHPEQLGFFAVVSGVNSSVVRAARVLEIGAYDVNGSIRGYFSAASEFVGVDLTAGPGVDLVSYGHEVDQPEASFDISLSGECFEHDPYWRQTFENMVRLTRPGGLVALTCASSGRPEHGTGRTRITDSPGTQSQGLNYYCNLDEADFAEAHPLEEMFSSFRFWYLPTSFDLYFAGVRRGNAPPGTPTAELPVDDQVEALEALTSVPHRLARAPLHLARRIVSDDDRYQRVVLPYWLMLLRLQGRVRRR